MHAHPPQRALALPGPGLVSQNRVNDACVTGPLGLFDKPTGDRFDESTSTAAPQERGQQRGPRGPRLPKNLN